MSADGTVMQIQLLRQPDRCGVVLDDDSIITLRSLSRLTSEFRQSTSNVRRIQRGSPGAGALGTALRTFQPKFMAILIESQAVFARNSQFPGMNLLKAKLTELQQTLQEPFNDGGNEAGYYQRVNILEKLNYMNGMLRGVVEVMIEHHEYWKNKLDGQNNQPLSRRLNFQIDGTPENPQHINAPQRPPDHTPRVILGKFPIIAETVTDGNK